MTSRVCASSCVLACFVLSLGACDTPAEDDEPGACFPVPSANVSRAGHVRPPEEDAQGRSQQGGHAPGEEMQGSSMQGSSLQGGRGPGDDLQGASLQGGRGPGDEIQGTSLQHAHAPGDEAQGTSLQNGRKLQGRYLGLADLNGAQLRVAATRELLHLRDGELIAPDYDSSAAFVGVELRASTRDGRDLVLQIDSSTHGSIALVVDGESVCSEGEAGIFVGGYWTDDGAHVDEPDTLTFACEDGVIAKCVAWGYAPWTTDVDVHQACTRLARADYCGDGNSWTLDGTIIDAYDNIGVQGPVPDAKFRFEAAWDVDGAVCVSRTRYDVRDGSDRTVLPACFAGLPACRSIDDEIVGDAVLANRSTQTTIAACE